MTEALATGQWHGMYHDFPVRVYYAATDAGGVVYHARYLDFAEQARTEMLRSLMGEPSRVGATQGLVFVVRTCDIDYQNSAVLDDVLVVRSRLLHLGGASLKIRQDVFRGETLLVRITIVLVAVKEMGRATRLPDPMRVRLAEILAETLTE